MDDARANLKIRQMADSLGSYRFVDEAEEEEKVYDIGDESIEDGRDVYDDED